VQTTGPALAFAEHHHHHWLSRWPPANLQNFMNMYDVDFMAQGIAFVYVVDQSQIAGTEAACWP